MTGRERWRTHSEISDVGTIIHAPEMSGHHQTVLTLPKTEVVRPTVGTIDVTATPPDVVLPRGPRTVKRWVDVVGGAVLLVLLSPILLVAAAIVRVTSSGPVLFRQTRVGQHGRPFKMLKLRTMHCDAQERLRADPLLHQLWLDNACKLPAETDPRYHRFGPLLRRFSIDELPQLVNVIRGDMSLVGPRPVEPVEFDHFYRSRGIEPVYTAVRPGLTGLWQVSGRSSIGHPEKGDLDVQYVLTWRLSSDARMLVQTLAVVFRREGAH